MPGSVRRRLALLCAVAVAAGLAGLALARSGPGTTWSVLRDPIDARQLTGLPFGARSASLQPWRSSLITRPALALEDALGMNFNVTPAQADATAHLLADSGVRRVRIEFPWSVMSYGDPAQIADPAPLITYLTAFRRYRLRPLILLNANSGLPGPAVRLDLTLAAPAPAGATTVQVAAADIAEIVPGLTGVDAGGDAAGVLITAVSAGGLAMLSRPLPTALPAGATPATTLRYAPFAPPTLPGGAPNPRFAQTLAGWLAYVRAVCDLVRTVYGSDDFDVEVWNELSFGSDFLDEARYFSPVPDPGATGSVTAALLAGTVAWLRDPANGLTGVRVGDGFASETPFVSGATVPAGTAALDHHPYPPLVRSAHSTLFFPEYFLTGIQTETLMRDLSPIQTPVDGVPHGATTHPPGGPAPANWVTEVNLDAAVARRLGMPAADIPELQAKAALRFYLAYAGEGAAAVDLFAAGGGGCCQLVSPGFLAAAAAGGGYPGDAAGGRPLAAVARMVASLHGATAVAAVAPLTLTAVASADGAAGQPTGGGPPLPNRDVLAFLPFQVTARRYVAAVYVMTHNLARRYTARPAADQTPYDLPPERFRLTIGGVDGRRARVALTDPLSGSVQPLSVIGRTAHGIVVALKATDSPRMLTIEDQPPA